MISVTAFLDTSTFLHFRWLGEIDWRSLLAADEVDLVVPAVVLDELDQKKYDGSPKLKRRARAALQKLAPLYSNATVPSQVREKVRVRFVGNAATVDFPAMGLDYKNNDDRLIAAVLEFRVREPGANLALVAGDGGLTMRASLQDIRVLALPDEYAQREEPDPLEAENRALKEKLAEHETRMPRLLITFSGGTDRGEFEVRPPVEVSEVDVTRRLAELKTKYPIYDRQTVATFGPAFQGLFGAPTTDEIRRYNEERETFFAAMRQYWITAAAGESRDRRSFQLALTVNNQGTAVADNVITDLYFPDGLVIHENPPELSEPPRVPIRPRNAMELMAQSFDSLPSVLSEGLQLDPGPRNVSRPRIERTNSYRVGVRISRVQHHVPVRLPRLAVEFEQYDSARSFTVDWAVRSASLPNPVSGELHVIVTKKP